MNAAMQGFWQQAESGRVVVEAGGQRGGDDPVAVEARRNRISIEFTRAAGSWRRPPAVVMPIPPELRSRAVRVSGKRRYSGLHINYIAPPAILRLVAATAQRRRRLCNSDARGCPPIVLRLFQQSRFRRILRAGMQRADARERRSFRMSCSWRGCVHRGARRRSTAPW